MVLAKFIAFAIETSLWHTYMYMYTVAVYKSKFLTIYYTCYILLNEGMPARIKYWPPINYPIFPPIFMTHAYILKGEFWYNLD